jgi:hypothetical protein
MAYRARLPLRSAGSATSDDRGVFRIYGLEPGKYWVRSGGHTLEDKTGWLPTFGPQSRETRNAHVHKVTVDTDTSFADVSPEPGQLFSVGGAITCEILGRVLVTLSSDTGQRRSETGCPGGYGFDGLAPGVYELFATLENDAASGFLEVNLGGSLKVDLSLMASPIVDLEVRRTGSDGNTDVPLTLTGRRQDLSETETVRQIKGPRTTLAPGYWELRAQLPPGWYVDSIVNQRSAFRSRRKAQQASDWYEVFIEPRVPARIRINVSDQAGQIAGRVVAEGKPVPGAPLFLWPVAESARRSLGGPPKSLSDIEGNFRFASLPPGDYRLLASFDANEVDEESIEASRAPLVRAEALKTATIDLPLWVAPY